MFEAPVEFTIGDIVWAQARGLPSWPGKIVDERDVGHGKAPADSGKVNNRSLRAIKSQCNLFYNTVHCIGFPQFRDQSKAFFFSLELTTFRDKLCKSTVQFKSNFQFYDYVIIPFLTLPALAKIYRSLHLIIALVN